MQFVIAAALLALAHADPAFHGLGALTGYGGHGLGFGHGLDFGHGLAGHGGNLDLTDDDHHDDHFDDHHFDNHFDDHHFDDHFDDHHLAPAEHVSVLSCIRRFEGDDGNVHDSLSVNIKAINNGYGFPAYGAGYGAGFGAAMGGHGGLEAQVNVFSTTGGEVTIALMDDATDESCAGDKYGHFLGASVGFGGHGFGGYGHGFGGYGHGFGHGFGHSDAVIAKSDLHANQLASFHVDHLAHFTSLGELAGRGVIVCPTENVVHAMDGTLVCQGTGKSCCALHYAHEESHIGA